MKRPLGHKSRRGFPWRLRLSQLELSWETLRSRRRVASSVDEAAPPASPNVSVPGKPTRRARPSCPWEQQRDGGASSSCAWGACLDSNTPCVSLLPLATDAVDDVAPHVRAADAGETRILCRVADPVCVSLKKRERRRSAPVSRTASDTTPPALTNCTCGNRVLAKPASKTSI